MLLLTTQSSPLPLRRGLGTPCLVSTNVKTRALLKKALAQIKEYYGYKY